MSELTLHQLHEIVGGRLRLATLGPRDGEWTRLPRICTDSRQVQPGDVFWALRGSKHDGAAFVESAFARGASGVIAEKYVQPWPSCWSLQVDDSHDALCQFAEYRREHFHGQLIALGGATGTATTHRMIAAVLNTRFRGSSCPQRGHRSDNITFGMLTLEPAHDYAIFDLNLAAPGDVSALIAECEPTLAVISDAARLRSSNTSGTAIHNEAAQLLAHLSVNGRAVLNGDDPAVRYAAKQCRASITWVGESEGCDIVATRVLSTQGRLSFVIDGQTFHVAAWGRHQLASALSAVGVGRLFGLSLAEIARALEGFDPPPSECEIQTPVESRKTHVASAIQPTRTKLKTTSLPGDIIAMRPLVKAINILRFDIAHSALRRAA